MYYEKVCELCPLCRCPHSDKKCKEVPGKACFDCLQCSSDLKKKEGSSDVK